MAMNTETKLYVALGVLGVLGGGLYLQNKQEAEHTASHTLSGQAAALPKIDIKDDDLKAIDKIVLNKAGEDGGAPVDIELTLGYTPGLVAGVGAPAQHRAGGELRHDEPQGVVVRTDSFAPSHAGHKS